MTEEAIEQANPPSCFDSTVAMTVYNVLCTRGATGLRVDELSALTKELHHDDLDSAQFQRALRGLWRRHLVEEREGRYHVADTRRRLVVGRDRKDAHLGFQDGGWSGWFVQDRSNGTTVIRTLEAVLAEGGKA